MTARTLVIGDVHGCRDELEELILQFGFVPGKDRLIQTGDMVTRGPDTIGALQLARELGIASVRGNQEERLLEILRRPSSSYSTKDLDFLSRFQGHAEEAAEIVHRWPLWIEESEFFVVHAGFEPGKKHPSEMSPHILTQIRTWDGSGERLDDPANPAWYECGVWDKVIVFGHWAARGLVQRYGLRGLDTGCASGGWLTGWCPEDDRIYSVPSRINQESLLAG